MVPSAEKVRLANSGTEATLAAIRLARGGILGKKKILKFEGHFQGMHEFLFYTGITALEKTPRWRDRQDMGYRWNVEELDDLIIIIPFNDEEILDRTL